MYSGTFPDEGDVRLVNGYRPAEGRVEIYYNGCWGTICDDFWSLNDATVVCNQLGYPRALQALRVASHGQGTGAIVLDDLLCSGTEENLLQCPSFTSAGIHNCAHFEDASVVCENDISKGLYIRIWLAIAPSYSYVVIADFVCIQFLTITLMLPIYILVSTHNLIY